MPRGQAAAYVVQVSTENGGSASNVSVAIAAQPSSQKPTFTSGCAKGDGTATCAVGSGSQKQPATLHALTSVKLTATASIATAAKWTPPAAAETVTVTGAAAAKSAGASPETSLPLGPIPNLNGVSSSLIGAGSAAGLFPAIVPSSAPAASAAGGHQQGGQRNAEPVSDTSALAPGLSGQLAGLIALALAVMLTVTRLSLLKRFRSRKQGS